MSNSNFSNFQPKNSTVVGIQEWTGFLNMLNQKLNALYGITQTDLTFLSNVSAPFTPSSSGIYGELSNNSVILTPGTWKINGCINFAATSGGAPAYTNIAAWWCTANGLNTSSQPSVLNPLYGLNFTQYYTSAYSVDTLIMPIMEIIVTVSKNTPIYLVPYIACGTYTQSVVTAYLTAQLISV